MAVEKKRGCGYRKVGGLYLVGGGIGVPCDRLPFELTVCACCGQGIKPALGWTWIDVAKFFNGSHMIERSDVAPIEPCGCKHTLGGGLIECPLCYHPETLGRAGLLWIGEKFYKMPADFIKEGVEMGFSRRIKAVPHGFKIGETWIMLAHRNTIAETHTTAQMSMDVHDGKTKAATETGYKPGIFYAWKPQRIEKILLESQRNAEEVKDLEKRGVTPVFVPDDDADHKGNVHDDKRREDKERREREEEENQ